MGRLGSIRWRIRSGRIRGATLPPVEFKIGTVTTSIQEHGYQHRLQRGSRYRVRWGCRGKGQVTPSPTRARRRRKYVPPAKRIEVWKKRETSPEPIMASYLISMLDIHHRPATAHSLPAENHLNRSASYEVSLPESFSKSVYCDSEGTSNKCQ